MTLDKVQAFLSHKRELFIKPVAHFWEGQGLNLNSWEAVTKISPLPLGFQGKQMLDLVVFGSQMTFVFKLRQGWGVIFFFECHRKLLFLDPVPVRRAFCGEEWSERGLPASEECFSFGGASRGHRLTFLPTSNPQSQWPTILSGSVSQWQRSAALTQKVWIKKWIYQPVRGDGRLVDGRLAGNRLRLHAGKQGSGEREPQSPVREFRWWLKRLEQTSTIKPSAEPWLPPPPPTGDLWTLPAVSAQPATVSGCMSPPSPAPTNTLAIQRCAILILCPLRSCFTAQR